MRKHKRKLLAAVALALVVMAVLAVRPRPDRVTVANFDRIKWRMSRAELEAILGPPGDYRTGPSGLPKYGSYRSGPPPLPANWGAPVGAQSADWMEAFASHPEPSPLFWYADQYKISVTFGPHGVLSVDIQPLYPREQGRLENLTWRFRRLWWQLFPPAQGSRTIYN
jgi:hypothetical protein